jgi:hypothetical protein
MSNADTRAAIAAAISTVDGLTGYVKRPTAMKPGDGWPQWRGAARADGFGFLETWAVLVVLPDNETTADEWADSHGYALATALEPVMFVESIAPATIPASGNDIYALMITGRTE